MQIFMNHNGVKRQQVTTADEEFQQKFTRSETLFLEKIWSPIALHGEEIWKSENPLGRIGSIQSMQGFWFTQHGARLFIEINDHHSDQLSMQEQWDYMQLQNELMLSGWQVLRLTAFQLVKEPAVSQNLLRRALDFSQSQQSLPPSSVPPDLWKIRKQQIIEIAQRHNGKISPREVAAEFNVNIRSAAEWLKQFATEGLLSFVSGPRPTKIYRLNQSGH